MSGTGSSGQLALASGKLEALASKSLMALENVGRVDKESRMKLIKVGSAYLNMDLVTDIWVDQGRVSIFFAVPVMYNPVPFQGITNAVTTREIQFVGPQAEALIQWLEKRAKDITPDGDQHSDGPPEVQIANDLALTGDSADDGPSS